VIETFGIEQYAIDTAIAANGVVERAKPFTARDAIELRDRVVFSLTMVWRPERDASAVLAVRKHEPQRVVIAVPVADGAP